MTAPTPGVADEHVAACPKCGESDAPMKWDNGKCWTCGYCDDDTPAPASKEPK